MMQLRGHSNIVSCEDFVVIPRTGEIGYDILIRMELLTPLTARIRQGMTTADVARLGVGICRALELCHGKNIIHRDVKPDNIFVSETGDYKLGDFGVARQMSNATRGLSKQGTPLYMAPEVYLGKPYDATADLYSLGLVLHYLLNGRMMPFAPMTGRMLTHEQRDEAFQRRISGEELPLPV